MAAAATKRAQDADALEASARFFFSFLFFVLY
jgi:hypothetical protein